MTYAKRYIIRLSEFAVACIVLVALLHAIQIILRFMVGGVYRYGIGSDTRLAFSHNPWLVDWFPVVLILLLAVGGPALFLWARWTNGSTESRKRLIVRVFPLFALWALAFERCLAIINKWGFGQWDSDLQRAWLIQRDLKALDPDLLKYYEMYPSLSDLFHPVEWFFYYPLVYALKHGAGSGMVLVVTFAYAAVVYVILWGLFHLASRLLRTRRSTTAN